MTSMTLSPTELARLVERLQRVGNAYDDGGMMRGELVNPDGPDAADALLAMQSRIGELEEALKEIAHMNLNVPFVSVRAMDIARAALKEKTNG